uniref:Uncharacterized protein n=1 Tax=Ananas comosus var. bracteatus TaxID=296719 RepID=A0A6V7QBZ1_ANACO|nr:unnamed protein product [Ananas comosus var. bracteatus]
MKLEFLHLKAPSVLLDAPRRPSRRSRARGKGDGDGLLEQLLIEELAEPPAAHPPFSARAARLLAVGTYLRSPEKHPTLFLSLSHYHHLLPSRPTCARCTLHQRAPCRRHPGTSGDLPCGLQPLPSATATAAASLQLSRCSGQQAGLRLVETCQPVSQLTSKNPRLVRVYVVEGLWTDPPSPLALALRIEMPGIDLEAYRCIMSFPVVLGNRAFLANLVLIPIKEFDVVLGMDWLTKHHASIDYERSTVNSRCPMKRSSFTKHVRAHSSL